MSAFINDSQLPFAGFLGSGLAELSTTAPVAYGFETSADDRGGNNQLDGGVNRLSAELTELDLVGEPYLYPTPNRPLVPSSPGRYSSPSSVYGTAANADVLLGQEQGAGGSTYRAVASTQSTTTQAQADSGEAIVQAEDYRRGGNGVTYFDTTAENLGGQYRADAVDIQKTSDSGGGYNVGWIRPGEWLTYDVGLASGNYDVVIRAAAKGNGGRLQVSSGQTTEDLRIGSTRSWQTFQNFTIENFQVSDRQTELRLDALSGQFNLNYIKFVPSSSSSSSSSPSSPSSPQRSPESRLRVEAEDYSTYFDTTSRNFGKAYRNDGVDIRANSGSSGGFKVIGTQPGEWLQYDFSPKVGTYDIILRASTNANGARVELSLGDTTLPFELNSRKGFGRNRSFVAKGIAIGADVDSFRLDVRSGLTHLDYVEFVPRSTRPTGTGGSQGGENNGAQSSEGGNGVDGGGSQNSGGGNGEDGGGQGGNAGSGLGSLPQGSFDETFGYGLINASAAASYALGTEISTGETTNSGSNSNSLNAINVADVWQAGITGNGQTIAVLDTGVDIRHRDLAANIWTNSGEVAGDGIDNDGNGYVDDVNGYDFTDSDGDVSDDNGHGTHISGIVAGLKNSSGITGIAHEAKIMPVKILDADGLGYFDDIAKGIRYAVDNGADVLNLSLAVDYSESSLRNAISYAYDKGAVVVSAAGNYGGDRPLFPARYADRYGLAVGTVDSNNQYQSYSNKAGSSRLDYVVAPGQSIVSTAPGGGTAIRSGTSQSTAQVAGVAALIRSANPNLSAKQVEDLIARTANSQAVSV
ncbi:MAG: S8 family serine peptidase [Cyanobacteria bacterium P01_E01_bin.45]